MVPQMFGGMPQMLPTMVAQPFMTGMMPVQQPMTVMPQYAPQTYAQPVYQPQPIYAPPPVYQPPPPIPQTTTIGKF